MYNVSRETYRKSEINIQKEVLFMYNVSRETYRKSEINIQKEVDQIISREIIYRKVHIKIYIK